MSCKKKEEKRKALVLERAGRESLLNVRISILSKARRGYGRRERPIPVVSWDGIQNERSVLKVLEVGLCFTHDTVKVHQHGTLG